MDTLAILGLSTIGSEVIMLIITLLLLCLPYGPAYDGIRDTITTGTMYLLSAPASIIESIFIK